MRHLAAAVVGLVVYVGALGGVAFLVVEAVYRWRDR